MGSIALGDWCRTELWHFLLTYPGTSIALGPEYLSDPITQIIGRNFCLCSEGGHLPILEASIQQRAKNLSDRRLPQAPWKFCHLIPGRFSNPWATSPINLNGINRCQRWSTFRHGRKGTIMLWKLIERNCTTACIILKQTMNGWSKS